MPVLPLDESMISLSRVSAPLAMASRIIWKAARSLTEPPGFMNSHLAQISMPGEVAVDRAQPHDGRVADEIGDALGHPRRGPAPPPRRPPALDVARSTAVGLTAAPPSKAASWLWPPQMKHSGAQGISLAWGGRAGRRPPASRRSSRARGPVAGGPAGCPAARWPPGCRPARPAGARLAGRSRAADGHVQGHVGAGPVPAERHARRPGRPGAGRRSPGYPAARRPAGARRRRSRTARPRASPARAASQAAPPVGGRGERARPGRRRPPPGIRPRRRSPGRGCRRRSHQRDRGGWPGGLWPATPTSGRAICRAKRRVCSSDRLKAAAVSPLRWPERSTARRRRRPACPGSAGSGCPRRS